MRLVAIPAPTIPIPTLVAITQSQSVIQLSAGWAGIPFNRNFNFETSLSATGPFTALASQTLSSFTHGNLNASTTIFYRVRVSIDGGLTAYSPVQSATTLAAAVINPPPNGRTYKKDFSIIVNLGIGVGGYAQFTALCDSVRGTGVNIQWYPHLIQYDQGTASANYTGSGTSWGRTYVKACLDYAWNNGVNPVFVAWGWVGVTYGGTESSVPGGTYPPWMVSLGNDWILNINPSKTNTNSILCYWFAGPLAAMQALDADFAANFDSHPALIMYMPVPETGIDSTIPGTTGGTYVNYILNCWAQLTAAKDQFLHTPIRWPINNMDTLNRILNYEVQMQSDSRGGWFVGGPDPGVFPGPGVSNNTKVVWNYYLAESGSGASVAGYTNFAGTAVGIYCEYQDNTAQYNYPTTTPGNLFAGAQALGIKNNYFSAQQPAPYSLASVIAAAQSAQGAVNQTPPDDGNTWYTPSIGTPPSAPTLLQSILEGQTQQAQGIYQQPITGDLDFAPQNANTRTLGWLAPVPSGSQTALSHYNLYRSDNPTAIYATRTVAQVTTDYGNYVANSANTTPGSGGQAGPWPYQKLVNCAWTDSACTNASGYPQGAGPDFYPGNALTYQVTAVDLNGLESAKSANMVKWYMSNGVLITCGGTFNGSMTPGATDGGLNPLTGNSAAVKWVTAGADDLINPFFDFGDTRWSGNLASFTKINLYVKASQSVGLQMHALRRVPNGSGDQDILASAGNDLTVNIGTATTSWQLIPISLAVVMTDYLDGEQTTGYKWDVQITSGGAGISLWIEWEFA
jgi:hypothetical protein